MNGEYKKKGEYHKNLGKKWKYYPIYKAKIDFLENFLRNFPKDKKILDVGCGEGILVEKFIKLDYDMVGLDLNYSSKYVKQGNVLRMPFKNSEFNLILCLDLIEHLTFDEQEASLKEIKRVLKKDGLLLLTIPNLAHLASRLSFLFAGRLIRTSGIERHKGDRPLNEYIKLLKKYNFKIIKIKGIFPTFPISSLLTYCFPSKVILLHKFLNRFLSYPNWCFLNIILVKKNNKMIL